VQHSIGESLSWEGFGQRLTKGAPYKSALRSSTTQIAQTAAAEICAGYPIGIRYPGPGIDPALSQTHDVRH